MYFSSSSFSIFLFYKTKIVEQKYINLDSTTFLLHLYIVCILHCVPCFPDTSTCIGTGAYIFHGCWDVGMMPACWHACMHACNELLHKLLRGKPPQQGYNTSDPGPVDSCAERPLSLSAFFYITLPMQAARPRFRPVLCRDGQREESREASVQTSRAAHAQLNHTPHTP
jgi:hypothetical protein